MSEFAVGKLLPNLNISLNINNDDTTYSSNVMEKTDLVNSSKVEIIRPSVNDLQDKKIYLNKDGGFTTGIDLIAQENSGVLNKRAERFGLDPEKIRPSISSLYESMGINLEKRDSAEMRRIRLDALHVRGVQELSSDEVINYFVDYGPKSLEWINDCSCNVLWFDEAGPPRALLGLSRPLPAQFPITDFIEPSKNNEGPDVSSLDLNDKEQEKMEIDDSSGHLSQLVDIAIPPGHWRLGVPHSKAKTILLRFATKDDKKSRGAEKRSKYYQKYGNPNYGGLKGLISSSRKHKAQVEANRSVIKKGSTSSYKSFSSLESDSSVPKIKKKSTIRMRMYADDEEAKRSRSRSHMIERKGSVHSRLGAKYTSEELCVLGSYQDWDKDSSYTRAYEYGSKNSNHSSLDLRSKLKRSRSNIKQTHARQFDRRYDEEKDYQKSVNIKKHQRVDNIKKDSRSFFKRKHRSPLCADEDDDDSERSSDYD